MTDELAIQTVNPQVRKQDNTVPYTVGGAVVGGAAGYGINHAVQKPMSHEDIIKTVKDTAEFSNRTKEGAPEAASWQTVKEKADEVETAKKELEQASKPQVPADTAEQKVYDDAVKAKEDAYKKLYEEKKAALEGNGSKPIDPKKLKKFEDLASTDLPTTNVRSGKPFKGDQLKNLYNNLTQELVDAEQALDNTLNKGLRKTKGDYITDVNTMLNQVEKDLNGKKPEQIAAYFAEKESGSWLTGKKPTTQYKRAIAIADKYYPLPKDLTNEQYVQIGKELAPGEKPAKGMLAKPVTVKNANGRNIVKTVYYDPNEARALLDSEVERIKGLRNTAADQIFAEAQRAVAIKSELKGLAEKVGSEININVAQKTGLFTPGTPGTPDVLNMSQIISEGQGTRPYTSGKLTLKGYAADIKHLEDALAAAKKYGTTATIPTNLNSNFAPGTSVQDALEQLKNRNIAYKEYVKQQKNLLSQLEQTVRSNPIIQELDNKITEAISGDVRVQKARTKLAEQFPALFGEAQATNLTAEQIEAQAKEYAEKNLKKSFQDNIDKAKAELDKVVGDKGKVNEELKKAAEDKLAKAEAALKEQTEALGKKFKTGGMNKWLAAGIGAVALAAAGFGMAASNKKS